MNSCDARSKAKWSSKVGAEPTHSYAPTGQKMQIMNGQASTKSIVNLPGGGQAIYTASGQYYSHTDHPGSTRFASTPSRTSYFDTAYAPFGEPYATSGTADLSFTGQRQDTVAGLYDFPAREYSIQGRWPSPDPAGLAAVDPSNPQSWNRYAYVMNNPLTYVDPLGLFQSVPAGCTVSYPVAGGPDEINCFTWWLVDPNFACTFMQTTCPNRGGSSGSSSGSSWVSWGLLKDIKNAVGIIASIYCGAVNPADVQTGGVGGDLGFLATEGGQVGVAANGVSGQLGVTVTHNADVGLISIDGYLYAGSIPNASDNSKVGGGFTSLTNFTNHVNAAVSRFGGSYGLDDKSKTATMGPSVLPYTLSFGTSRTGVLFNIPYAGYLLNPVRAACTAVGFQKHD